MIEYDTRPVYFSWLQFVLVFIYSVVFFFLVKIFMGQFYLIVEKNYGKQLLVPFTTTPINDNSFNVYLFAGLIALAFGVFAIVRATIRDVFERFTHIPAGIIHSRDGVVTCRKRFPSTFFQLRKLPDGTLCDCEDPTTGEFEVKTMNGTRIFTKGLWFHHESGPAFKSRTQQGWFWDGRETKKPELCELATRSDLTEEQWNELTENYDYVVYHLVRNSPHYPEHLKVLDVLTDNIRVEHLSSQGVRHSPCYVELYQTKSYLSFSTKFTPPEG